MLVARTIQFRQEATVTYSSSIHWRSLTDKRCVSYTTYWRIKIALRDARGLKGVPTDFICNLVSIKSNALVIIRRRVTSPCGQPTWKTSASSWLIKIHVQFAGSVRLCNGLSCKYPSKGPRLSFRAISSSGLSLSSVPAVTFSSSFLNIFDYSDRA